MNERGFLWEDLSRDVEAEFAALGVPVDTSRVADTGFLHWHVEKPGRGLRPVGPQKANAQSVRELRARRRANGLCIHCGAVLDPASKNFCPRHREADRQAAERRRVKRMEEVAAAASLSFGDREKLSTDRSGLTHHFTVTGANALGEVEVVDGYVTTGEYVDGRLGEFFVRVGKAGDERAVFDTAAKLGSLALQHGASVKSVTGMLIHDRYGIGGRTSNEDIPTCSSITDYVAKWLRLKYGVADGAEGAAADAGVQS